MRRNNSAIICYDRPHAQLHADVWGVWRFACGEEAIHLLFLIAILLGRKACQSLEILAEETDVREIQLIGNLCSLPVAMAQLHLGGRDDGSVYPLLRTHSAHRHHKRAQIATGDAKFLGIEGKLMLLAAMEIDKAQETIEDLIGMGRRRYGCTIMKELVTLVSNKNWTR